MKNYHGKSKLTRSGRPVKTNNSAPQFSKGKRVSQIVKELQQNRHLSGDKKGKILTDGEVGFRVGVIADLNSKQKAELPSDVFNLLKYFTKS